MHKSLLRAASVVSFGTVLILGLVALATWIRLGSAAWDEYIFRDGIWKALLVTIVTQGCLYPAALYHPRPIADRRDLFIKILQALGAASFILAAIYVFAPEMALGRGIFLITAALVFLAWVGWGGCFLC